MAGTKLEVDCADFSKTTLDLSYRNVELASDLSLRDLVKHPNLEELLLNSSHLRTVPGGVCRLSSLKILRMNFNFLSTLPEGLFGLRHLIELSLYSNQLENLPREISKLTELRKLDLGSNLLRSLPSETTAQDTLQLDIQDNRLKFLDADLRHIPSLEVVGLARNPWQDVSISHTVPQPRASIKVASLKELTATYIADLRRKSPGLFKRLCRLVPKELSRWLEQAPRCTSCRRTFFSPPFAEIRLVRFGKDEIPMLEKLCSRGCYGHPTLTPNRLSSGAERTTTWRDVSERRM